MPSFRWSAIIFRTFNPFSPMSHFYTPWKRQKTYGFLTFSGGIEMWHWTKMDKGSHLDHLQKSGAALIVHVLCRAIKLTNKVFSICILQKLRNEASDIYKFFRFIPKSYQKIHLIKMQLTVKTFIIWWQGQDWFYKHWKKYGTSTDAFTYLI